MLVQYHLLFIASSFILLLISIYLLFLDKTKQGGIAALILIGLNLAICEMNYLVFFGIDLIGYTCEGTAVITKYPDMYMFFSFFFLMFWLNVALVYYCIYKQTHNIWELPTT